MALTAPTQGGPATAHPVTVTDPSQRLHQLHHAYLAAKADADAAGERLAQIAAGIKAELQAAAPGAEQITLPADGPAPALRLGCVKTWRVDTNRLKREQPETYVRYAKQTTSWPLRVVGDKDA